MYARVILSRCSNWSFATRYELHNISHNSYELRTTYHANIIAIQQNFGQFRLCPSIITESRFSDRAPSATVEEDLQFRDILQDHIDIIIKPVERSRKFFAYQLSQLTYAREQDLRTWQLADRSVLWGGMLLPGRPTFVTFHNHPDFAADTFVD